MLDIRETQSNVHETGAASLVINQLARLLQLEEGAGINANALRQVLIATLTPRFIKDSEQHTPVSATSKH